MKFGIFSLGWMRFSRVYRRACGVEANDWMPVIWMLWMRSSKLSEIMLRDRDSGESIGVWPES